MVRRAALDVALDMVQRPLLARQAQTQPLPDDVLQLIRIAADSHEDIDWASRTRARSSREIREAAVMFLQQVLFHPGADSFRLMGLAPTATLADLQEHRKWLLKWLHPDRNPDKWESLLCRRVLDAAGQAQKRLKEQTSVPRPIQSTSSSRHRRRRNSAQYRGQRKDARPTSKSEMIKRNIRRGCYAVVTLALLAIGWQLWNGQSLAEFPAVRTGWINW
ncbi:MAG: J domain-containing protein [Hyphomicrobiales bacterium]